ncbi:protein-disulfide reductase DsbD family protein [Thermomonas flagellata]|uniref:protein-disulfide reductase DsbD family protein n=1 Tax=Thermomonas flagellata TaxID=2888524 RepID=UPI001F03B0B0|nr:protein-disulfide reductase DsbD [Thermomonas flagellata]
MIRFPLRLRRALAALALTLGLSVGLPLATAPARAADVALPPVDQVFVLSARATAPDRIEVQWTIADGYYLYRHRTAVTADPGFGQTRLLLPEGARHHDEFFGDVQTYRRRLVAVLEGHPAPGTRSATLTVKYQGCADAGVCYPPQTRTLQVALPAAGPAPSAAAGEDGFGLAPRRAGGLFAVAGGAAAEALPLPPEQAFASEVIARDGHSLLLRLTPAPGYYLYRDKLSVRLEGAPGSTVALPSAGRLPLARAHRDEHFGEVAVYFDQVEIPLPLARRSPEAAQATLVLGLQGCQDGGICYPPMTRRLAVDLPAAPAVPAAAEAVPARVAPAADAPPAAIAAVPPSDAMPAAAAPATAGEVRTPPPAAVAPAAGRGGLWLALLLALLGGVILNLMPCVLPVLTLKALGLAQSGESRARARRHALAYTAGVLLSFAALGVLALALRRAGMALGWGFQLQQPLVVAVLGLVIFAFGLNLSGVWQFGLAVGGRAGALTRRDGPAGDFFTGVLAVVLATPCTAPFMGSALAYAFTGPWLGGLLVFLALGLGLALPFLLVGFVPALAARLPRPGPWMEHFRQLLAFPLYATAAWLLYVLAALRGAEAVWHFALAAIALALALWAWNRTAAGAARGWRLLAIVAALALAWPLASVHRLPKPAARSAAVQPDGPPRVAWSEQALADLRRQGRVVFVNMTADWCVSCKANEKAVFAREDFGRWLEAADAVYMVGDYTDVDPAITAYLERHGAVGVPLYVVYPRGGGEGRVLPVILTPERVRAALAAAARGGR